MSELHLEADISRRLAPQAASAGVLTYPGIAPCDTTLQACITGASSGDIIEIATNDRIKLTFSSQFCQVPAKTVQRGSLALGLATLFFLLLGFFCFHTCS